MDEGPEDELNDRPATVGPVPSDANAALAAPDDGSVDQALEMGDAFTIHPQFIDVDGEKVSWFKGRGHPLGRRSNLRWCVCIPNWGSTLPRLPPTVGARF